MRPPERGSVLALLVAQLDREARPQKGQRERAGGGRRGGLAALHSLALARLVGASAETPRNGARTRRRAVRVLPKRDRSLACVGPCVVRWKCLPAFEFRALAPSNAHEGRARELPKAL